MSVNEEMKAFVRRVRKSGAVVTRESQGMYRIEDTKEGKFYLLSWASGPFG